MSSPKIEEIVGKKPEEIAFFEDSAEMVNYAYSLSFVLSREQAAVLYKKMEKHYRALAAIDGTKDTFVKMADYFAEESKRIEETWGITI